MQPAATKDVWGCVNTIANCFYALGTCVIAAMAVYAANTWRVQLWGKVDYLAARRVLVALYRYRDWLQYGARTIVLVDSEYSGRPGRALGPETWEDVEFAYQRRFEKATRLRMKLIEQSQQAEAIWNDRSRYELLRPLYDQEAKLAAARDEVVQWRKQRGEYPRKAADFFFYCAVPQSSFDDDFNRAVEAFAAATRSRMGRHTRPPRFSPILRRWLRIIESIQGKRHSD